MITDTFAETSRPLTSGEPHERFQSAVDATKACVQDTLAHTGHYVRSHPVPVLLGALAFGVVMGCALSVAGRREESMRERLLDQKLSKFRDALYEALEPVAEHLKDDCASVQKLRGQDLLAWQPWSRCPARSFRSQPQILVNP